MGRTAALPFGVYGSDGEIGPISPPRLATRRDGGANAHLGSHSCRNDGGSRGIPGGAIGSAVHPISSCSNRHCSGWNNHLLPRCLHRPHPNGPEKRSGLQHRVPTRLHDAGHGVRGSGCRDVPSSDARIFQSHALFGLGFRHPCHGRGGGPRTRFGSGHAPNGRFAPKDADYRHHLFYRLHCDQRNPSLGRLLEQR